MTVKAVEKPASAAKPKTIESLLCQARMARPQCLTETAGGMSIALHSFVERFADKIFPNRKHSSEEGA